MKIQHYGWKRSQQDKIDRAFRFQPAITPASLPSSVDLRPICIPKVIYDQGQLGSCTANAWAALAQTLMIKQKPGHSFQPSRNFIYYNEREIDGTINEDSGAQLADGAKVLSTLGVPAEISWPYEENRWLWKPFDTVYTIAAQHKIDKELNLNQDLYSFKACLASGFPFVGGFTVYESFESNHVARTGVVNLPGSSEQIVGGHAIMVVGYDDANQRFIVRNSWGASWGQAGYFTIPYDYFTNFDLAGDFWTAKFISGFWK